MLKVKFIQPDGSEQVVDTDTGLTLMESAKMNDVPGIEAECGGACACATCHVYVDDAWRDKTGTPSQMEEDMLDFAFDVREVEPPKLSDQADAGARRARCARAGKTVLKFRKGSG